MKELIMISPKTKYHFSIKEIAFISGLTQGGVKQLLHRPNTKLRSGYNIEEINNGFEVPTGVLSDSCFTTMLQQVNIRLWQYLRDVRVVRKQGSKGYVYSSLKDGATELIRTFSNMEQKCMVCQLMERSKFNPNWRRKDCDEWMKGIRASLGMLAL